LKANGRSRKKFIPYLKNSRGECVWSHGEKEDILQEYFQNILGTSEHRQAAINWNDIQLPRLSNQVQLDRPFTEDEIKAAISEFPTEKAPRPDGFTGVFYRSCWDIVKQDLLAAFQCIYNQTTGPLLKLNGAVLTLLPKKDVSEAPNELRPISLIHSFTKLVVTSPPWKG
jgi:hypothetical protein